MNSDIRWKQRFDNFDRAFVLLREVYDRGVDSLSQLEKEGAIQRFEVAFELAWKTPQGLFGGKWRGRESGDAPQCHQGSVRRQTT
ncbi:MAG: nucleotidyltransferase substrate binding protein [Candidatus Binatia bacterium]